MEDKLEKIKNLGLEIVCDSPRLYATYGDYTKQVMAKIGETSFNGEEILRAHFTTLPFSIKPNEYWDAKTKELFVDGRKLLFTPFQFDYLKWNAMLGIKVIPDALVLNDVLTCLKSTFGIHNEKSITEAINLNLRGVFSTVVDSFGQINRAYLCKVLVPYEKKLKEDLRLSCIIRDKLKMEDKTRKEQSPEYEAERLKQCIKDVFKEFKIRGEKDSIDLISYVIYDYLDKHKILNISPEEKKALMSEANTRIVLIENGATLKSLTSKAVGYNNEATVCMAKRLAVRNFFNSINELSV
jgi:hypothetical protein